MEKKILTKQKVSNDIKPVVKLSDIRKCYWVGIIGETEHAKLPFGGDSPMRDAVEKAFKEVTGHEEEVMYSGWSADKKAVENILNAWKSRETIKRD